jgi:hypothetical protein
MAFMRFPADIWSPSVIIFMPRINMPETPEGRNEDTRHYLTPFSCFTTAPVLTVFDLNQVKEKPNFNLAK